MFGVSTVNCGKGFGKAIGDGTASQQLPTRGSVRYLTLRVLSREFAVHLEVCVRTSRL
jgi:hypothetical protein